MKKFLFILHIILLPTLGLSQFNRDTVIMKEGPFLRFEPEAVDLGKMVVNNLTDEMGNIEMAIHNDGAKPLIIQQVMACCGTTVKEWPRNPILPGKSGAVKVYFRIESRPSHISRTVTVYSNAANGASQKLAILGEVVVPAAKNEIVLP